MSVAFPLPRRASPARPVAASPAVVIPQLSRRAILAVWAAAALPMAALAWLVAPAVAHHLSGEGNVPMAKALLACLTGGLVWQFVLVAVLVHREQGTLHPSRLRDALWLHSPRSPKSGRVGGRLWLVLIPLLAAFYAEGLLPEFPHSASRDMAAFLDSHAGQSFLNGNWGWFAIILALGIFNTVLGEELLFRGYLLPRMNRAFGRHDWLVNGVLFAAYHLHMPWAVFSPLADSLVLAYPSKRYQSAWIGIAVHSAQSIAITAIVLGLVL